MILPDVNVLVYALVGDDERHRAYAAWLEAALEGPEPVALPAEVLTGVARIATHPRIMAVPAATEHAVRMIESLRSAPASIDLQPTPRTWDVFGRLCVDGGATGNRIPDAWLAAHAISAGATLMTADRGFARYPGLRFANPLDAS